MLCRALLLALLLFGLNNVALAQFVEDGDEQSASEDDGSPAERGGRADRGDRGERGARGERGEGFRGRGRPNPIFEALDVDGDGMITARELRQAVRNLKELDADGDGNISQEEASPRGGPGGFGGRGGDPQAMIDRVMENDADGDGQLSQEELPENMARMLTGADTNADGKISREELQLAMQNMRGGPGGGGGFGGGPGGGFGRGFGDPETMTRQIMSADQNGDGLISNKEMNPQMAGMMQGADTNGDGALNAKEVRQAMEVARQRMQQFRGQGGGGFGRGGGPEGEQPRERRRDREEDGQE